MLLNFVLFSRAFAFASAPRKFLFRHEPHCCTLFSLLFLNCRPPQPLISTRLSSSLSPSHSRAPICKEIWPAVDPTLSHSLAEFARGMDLIYDPVEKHVRSTPESPFYLFEDHEEEQVIWKLHWDASLEHGKFKPIYVDLDAAWKQLKRSVTMKSDPLYKAIGGRTGNQSKVIFDATSGLLKDSMLMLYYGHRVIACEKSSLLIGLLLNAIQRTQVPELSNLLIENFSLYHADSIWFMQSRHGDIAADVVYLDPMYRIKGKKARTCKEMQIFDLLHAPDDDADGALFSGARKTAKERVVVKRALTAHPLDANTTHSYTGKTTRYDMYKIF